MPSNITGLFALHTPHFAKQQTCWFACFYTKNFLCHEGPKIIQDFRDETHFFIIKRDFIHKFSFALSGRPSPLNFFNNSPPSPEIFSCTGFFVFFYISS